MKFTRSIYPEIPGFSGSPCWELEGEQFWIDADFNTRFPFGLSFCFRTGPKRASHDGVHENYLRPGPGFSLDLNPPLGEPNRLYMWAGRWHVILGLVSFRRDVPTGAVDDNGIPEFRTVLGWPHIDGCSRYRYHQAANGEWVRDDKPHPGSWGWLDVSRRGNGRL